MYGQPVPGQPVQLPYGQPVVQPYPGAPVPAPPPYGQPIPGPAVIMPPPAEVKWSGLAVGGAFKVPVVAFIGRLTDMAYDTQSQFGLRIIEKYDQVQILESPAPWPWATIDLSIKYSDREESGWGRHVGSAKLLGLAINATTLDQAKAELIGKVYELRQKDESYGEDTKTGQAFHGDVWRFMRVAGVGGAQAPQPAVQYAAPPPVAPVAPAPAGVIPTPAPVPVAPVPAPAPAPAPVAAQPVLQPVPAPAPAPVPVLVPTAFITTLDPSDTAAVRAKKLLHGRALNEFLGAALIDDVVKADSSFVSSIYDQSFIVGLKASGQVQLGQDGKFTVIS